ncbi:hypothetical protein F511_01076 [Dorcoceras hygrometricum]|uniref:Flavonoid-6-hydroxylase n=1 Tax=Dorcoceras hygrometricum TaxID=472368 RepID=A0A2Z7ALZ1_9LAMI|nr:hypothetical protein F511_01076 [Dorcoceras hygrometricum]
MEWLLSPWLIATAMVSIAATFVLGSFHLLRRKAITTEKLPPEAAGGWPFIGHLAVISGPEPVYTTLSNMADKYGPIFTIRLGTRRALIVNTWEAAKECFRINDINFSNRPRTAGMGIMGYNYAMVGLTNYSPYWREMRKISVLNLLSNKKVAILRGVRELEVEALMKLLFDQCKSKEKEKVVVDMKKLFGDMTISLMVRTVAGDVEKKVDVGQKEKWRQLIREFFKMMTVFTVSDVLPYLKWFDLMFSGMHKAMKKTGKAFDAVMQLWLEEHKSRQADGNQEFDFMGEMLSIAGPVSQQFPLYDADTINKATCKTMMLGGTDTMTITLTWALCLLLNNLHAFKKAQDELDEHVGKCRQVKESDLENLVYIKAIIKETLRLQPPIPVIPREAIEDCTVSGYFIPARTRLFVNLWKIHRDPRVWSNPTEFQPERFLESHKEIDVLGQHFELLPFGGGRRVCPAISFSLQGTQLALASFLHGFDVSIASGESIDMTGSFGTTNPKATPLEVVIKPRLPTETYA